MTYTTENAPASQLPRLVWDTCDVTITAADTDRADDALFAADMKQALDAALSAALRRLRKQHPDRHVRITTDAGEVTP